MVVFAGRDSRVTGAQHPSEELATYVPLHVNAFRVYISMKTGALTPPARTVIEPDDDDRHSRF
jgi:hypothetical protein